MSLARYRSVCSSKDQLVVGSECHRRLDVVNDYVAVLNEVAAVVQVNVSSCESLIAAI